jgi:hypothetical protein
MSCHMPNTTPSDVFVCKLTICSDHLHTWHRQLLLLLLQCCLQLLAGVPSAGLLRCWLASAAFAAVQ